MMLNKLSIACLILIAVPAQGMMNRMRQMSSNLYNKSAAYAAQAKKLFVPQVVVARVRAGVQQSPMINRVGYKTTSLFGDSALNAASFFGHRESYLAWQKIQRKKEEHKKILGALGVSLKEQKLFFALDSKTVRDIFYAYNCRHLILACTRILFEIAEYDAVFKQKLMTLLISDREGFLRQSILQAYSAGNSRLIRFIAEDETLMRDMVDSGQIGSAILANLVSFQRHPLLSGIIKDPGMRNESEAYSARFVKDVLGNGNLLRYATDEPFKAIHECAENIREKRKQEGYATFIHGQCWPYQLAVELNMDLWAMRNNTVKPTDYVMPHVRKPRSLSAEKIQRQEIIARGRETQQDRDHMLFLNFPFMGRAKTPGSCTADYIVQNNSMNNGHIDLEKVFEVNGYGNLYIKYKSEIDHLQKMHKNLSASGNLLVVSVREGYLSDLVLEVHVGGSMKAPVDAHRLAEYCKNPTDTEFALVVTHDLANNPATAEKGILKIEMVNGPNSSRDPAVRKAVQAFREQYDALIAKMREDIEALKAREGLWCQWS